MKTLRTTTATPSSALTASVVDDLSALAKEVEALKAIISPLLVKLAKKGKK